MSMIPMCHQFSSPLSSVIFAGLSTSSTTLIGSVCHPLFAF